MIHISMGEFTGQARNLYRKVGHITTQKDHLDKSGSQDAFHRSRHR